MKIMKSYFIKGLLYSTTVSVLVIIYTCFEHGQNTYMFLRDTKYKQTKGITSIDSVSDEYILTAVKFKFNVFNTKDLTSKALKYILLWTSDKNVPFNDLGKEQKGFIDRNCMYTNCFVTSDKYYLMGDYTKFDVIAFSGPELAQSRIYDVKLPDKRALSQKYVFVSIESSHYYKICEDKYDGVFNWTWTYKLDSEVRWGYIVIRNMKNEVIGPNKNMNWLKLENMDPVSHDFMKKLKSKTKAAAWFASHCFTNSRREVFVRNLQMELYKYKHDVDIYGKCGNLICSRNEKEKCDKRIATTYYFYLSFENAFSDDYVTEKLLLGLNNDAVPIVFGGANYSRFMPDGIYLNARELGVKELAKKMNELINDPVEYANYFRWKNHYWYHKTTEKVDTNEYCKICELLNDKEAVEKTTVYYSFKDWWNPNSSTCPDFESSAE